MDQLQTLMQRLKLGYELPDPTDAELEAAYNRAPGNLSGYDCPKCLNRGYSWRVTEGRRTAVECACMATRRAQQRMEKSGLGGLLGRYTFENFEQREDWQREAVQKARAFYRGAAEWFYIAGQPGCGKTHLCTALVGKLIESGRDTRYLRWVEDSQAIRFAGYEDREQLVRRYQVCGLLYIDDFLKTQQGEKPDKRDVQLAFELVNHRYVNHLPTIFSSERSPAEIMQIDEALGSRIHERAKGCTVLIGRNTGRNWRLRKEADVWDA